MSKVSLREYFDQRFVDFDRRLTDARQADRDRVELAFSASQTAINKAEDANERRLELLNEFRSQQAEEARKYVPRETFDLASGRIAALEKAGATLQGRAIAFAGFGALIGAAAIATLMRFLG